jgi:dienelactone hydrolase
MIGKAALAGALALLLATGALAQDPNFEAQRSIPDTPGSGPYPALMEVDPALPDHVVYRPADLARVGEGKLGVFVWGNGACADDGASARLHLSEIASHGYLVIAPGKWRNGPNAKEGPASPRTPGPDGTFPPPPTTAADLTEALDWALAEDARPGSRYAGLIDKQAVAAGGFSCGGVQALAIGGDPRLRTVVVQNSGLFADGAPRIAGMELTKSALRALHTPVIYIQGGETDIAYANGRDDFARIDHVPAVMVDLIGKGHGGTYFEPNGGKAARIAVDWLQWQLRGNAEAAKSFLGEDCGLCGDPEVAIERKNLR